MKRIRKPLALIIAVMFCIMPVSAFAESDALPEITTVMMGDVNGDGKVNPSDARTALRIAAKIESDENVPLGAVDADNNKKITAADARIILRVAASLDSFVYGFDGKGMANSVKILNSNNYYISANIEIMDMIVAKKGNNIYMTSTEITDILKDFLPDTDCGVLLKDDIIYILMSSDVNSSYIGVDAVKNKDLFGDLPISPDDINQLTDMLSAFIPQDIGAPILVKEDDNEYICYSYYAEGFQCMLYTDMSGMIIRVDTIADDSVSTMFSINSISTDIPSKYFDLSLYTML